MANPETKKPSSERRNSKKLTAIVAFALATYPASAVASTCRELLTGNSWTIGTMGQVVAILSAAMDLGLDRDGTANALQAFCRAHPNTDLLAVIDFLHALEEYGKKAPEIR